ncbi:hypothetical protein Tco_0054503 [Tanacetum coccineum]
MQGVSKTDFENYVKANDVILELRNMQKQAMNELVVYAGKLEKARIANCDAISVMIFQKMSHLVAKSTNYLSDALPHSFLGEDLSEILGGVRDELTFLKKWLEDVENENSNVSDSDEPDLLNTPLSDKVECFDPEDDIDEINAFLAMASVRMMRQKLKILRANNVIIDNTINLLQSSPEPDVCLRFKPDTAMKNDEDFNQGEIVLSLNVEDVNSFTFFIWTFLPFFTYPEASPVILSLRSEDLIFDPDISTFHFSLKPVPFSLPKDERIQGSSQAI